VLATGRGILPAVRVWTAKTGRFSFRPFQNPDPLPLGRPHLDAYPSTRGISWVWLDAKLLISGSALQVSLFIVACSHATVNRKILTLVHHCLLSMYWPPWWTKLTQTRHTISQKYASMERQRSLVVYFGWSGGRQVVHRHKRSIGSL